MNITTLKEWYMYVIREDVAMLDSHNSGNGENALLDLQVQEVMKELQHARREVAVLNHAKSDEWNFVDGYTRLAMWAGDHSTGLGIALGLLAVSLIFDFIVH